MASRIYALCADLMFGSRLAEQASAAGERLELVGEAATLNERLAAAADEASPVLLVVDLTDEALDGAGVVESLLRGPRAGELRTLGFYSHVDAAARERAERAGFDLVVPRSRMAREGPALMARLLEASPARRTSG